MFPYLSFPFTFLPCLPLPFPSTLSLPFGSFFFGSLMMLISLSFPFLLFFLPYVDAVFLFCGSWFVRAWVATHGCVGSHLPCTPHSPFCPLFVVVLLTQHLQCVSCPVSDQIGRAKARTRKRKRRRSLLRPRPRLPLRLPPRPRSPPPSATSRYVGLPRLPFRMGGMLL